TCATRTATRSARCTGCRLGAVRPAAAFAIAALTLAAAPSPVVEGPAAAAPEAHAFRLGALKFVALRSGAWVVPNNGTGSGPDPAAAAKLLAAAGGPGDRVVMSVDALLVRVGGHVVLLDAGLGPSDHTVLPQSLTLAGVRPDEITDVLVTHSHLDHVGGLV